MGIGSFIIYIILKHALCVRDLKHRKSTESTYSEYFVIFHSTWGESLLLFSFLDIQDFSVVTGTALRTGLYIIVHKSWYKWSEGDSMAENKAKAENNRIALKVLSEKDAFESQSNTRVHLIDNWRLEFDYRLTSNIKLICYQYLSSNYFFDEYNKNRWW